MNKDKWLASAEIIDALRIIPRLMLLGFMIFYIWYIIYVSRWYFKIEDTEFASTAFISSTITAIGAMFTWIGNTYIKTGRKWSEEKKDNK